MFANKSEAERGQIIGLHLAGKNPKEIAALLQFNIKTVRHWINVYQEQS